MNDDLIRRRALLKSFDRSCIGDCEFCPRAIYSPDEPKIICGLVQCAPAVDAEPVRHGYWIPQDNTHTKFMCSDCKGRNHDGSGKYCSECGCKMDAEVEG